VADLAARIGRTVAVADVLGMQTADGEALGDFRALSERGVRAVLAVPIAAQDRLLGVLVFHRALVGEWQATEIGLAEAVAREAAVALDSSRLLRESERRLAEQRALLKAGEALTSDLRFDIVIERLVEELRALPCSGCPRPRSAARSPSPARSARRSPPGSPCCGATSPRPSGRRRPARTRRSRR
jgi:GAF domain-containing protein